MSAIVEWYKPSPIHDHPLFNNLAFYEGDNVELLAFLISATPEPEKKEEKPAPEQEQK